MKPTRYEVLRGLLAVERQSKGMTQQDVAAKLGKPQSYVSKYESGERHLDLVEFVEVCEALSADPVEVLQRMLANWNREEGKS